MWAWNAKPPERCRAWERLGALARRFGGGAAAGRPDSWRPAEAAGLGDRPFGDFSQRLGPLLVDYGKQRLDAHARRELVALAEESGLRAAIDALFDGARVNVTEDRPALHMTLRAGDADRETAAERDRFLTFARRLREDAGARTVLHIGIGGSLAGPALVVDALADLRTAPRIRFLANVDGQALQDALADLDPATTQAIVVSKSFATLETRLNAEAVKSWFLERTCDPAVVASRFAAVTANDDAAEEFGIAKERRFAMADGVGGRFSLWSAAGLPIAIALGVAGFEELLAGARAVDEHFRRAPLDANLPVLLALLQVWNTNFLGAATHAVLPYDQRLRLLPDHLQQLEMESNGKSVRVDGEPAATHTCPVIWGGEETNGQHAFHQLLHQGTRAYSADFIACARPRHHRAGHHDWLLANCLAQSKAMLDGRDHADPHRRVAGGHPSTTILLDDLAPRSLGALLALYEHKVFCAGCLWRVNPFDQWGVEAGKALAAPIRDALAERTAPAEQDAATDGRIDALNRVR